MVESSNDRRTSDVASILCLFLVALLRKLGNLRLETMLHILLVLDLLLRPVKPNEHIVGHSIQINLSDNASVPS